MSGILSQQWDRIANTCGCCNFETSCVDVRGSWCVIVLYHFTYICVCNCSSLMPLTFSDSQSPFFFTQILLLLPLPIPIPWCSPLLSPWFYPLPWTVSASDMHMHADLHVILKGPSNFFWYLEFFIVLNFCELLMWLRTVQFVQTLMCPYLTCYLLCMYVGESNGNLKPFKRWINPYPAIVEKMVSS